MIKSTLVKILSVSNFLKQNACTNICLCFVAGSFYYQNNLVGFAFLLTLFTINLLNRRLILVILCASLGILFTQMFHNKILKNIDSFDVSKTIEIIITQSPDLSGFESEVVAKPKGSDYLMLVTFPKYENIEIGDLYKISGSFEEVDRSTQFGKYLFSQKILFEVKASKFEKIGVDKSLSSIGYKINKKITSTLKEYYDEPYYSLFAGITIGQDAFDKSYSDKVRISGLSHILAVSGFNLLISFNFLLSFSKFINRKALLVGSFFFMLFYLAIVGFDNLTAFRALLVVVVYLIGSLFGRKAYSINALIYSLFIFTLIYPFYLSAVSIQLSVLASLGVLFIKPLVDKKLKFIKISALKDLMSTSTGAYVATLPIIIYYFGSSSPIGIVPNILILPLIPIVTVLGLLFEIISLVDFEALNYIIFLSTYPILKYIDIIITTFSSINFPLITTQNFVPIYFTIMLIVFIPFKRYEKT